jgi:hypothetical protein
MIRRVTLLFFASAILLSSAELRAGQQIWQDVSLQARAFNSKTSLFQVDDSALRLLLMRAPLESTGDWSHQIRLPMPDGKIVAFRVVESPIVAAGLAARYPGIKTFKVRGIDDTHDSGRIGLTPRGLHGMIHSSAGVIYLDPEEPSSQTHVYRSRFKGNAPPEKFSCGVHDTEYPVGEPVNSGSRFASRTQGELLQYRLAVAATIEYYRIFNSSLVDTIAAITMTIMRVNSIYERDLGITLKLVANNDLIIETVDKGLLNNENSLTLLGQVENWIDTRLPGGDADYDIGHMFSAPKFVGGGVAFLGVVCNDDFKANGVTGLPDPKIGDPFDIDFVAHEIGHQFNAEHSFNGTTNSCASGRNEATAFEPGSGSSVMAYAGICGQENLQSFSDATFHAGSIVQIDSFTRGAAKICAVLVATTPVNNNDPTITAIANRTIPANTPFVLDGIADDVDPMPTLTYQWDQMDAGCPTDTISFGTDNGSNALFRSYLPRGESWRNFPALGTQVQGRFDKAEVLPCQNRDLNFRLTARDGNSGQDIEDVRVVVDNSAGPFEITNLDPAPLIIAGTAFDVNWDVANTNLPPINCLNVDFDLISFSTDYSRYSIHPLDVDSNLNDGSALVTLNPDPLIIADPLTATHTRSRMRVKCSDNIFYDISGTDLTVTATTMPSVDLGDTDIAAYSFENMFITDAVAPACGAVVDCTAPPLVDDGGSKGGGSGGAFAYLWLLMLTGLIGLVNRCRRYGLQ